MEGEPKNKSECLSFFLKKTSPENFFWNCFSPNSCLHLKMNFFLEEEEEWKERNGWGETGCA